MKRILKMSLAEEEKIVQKKKIIFICAVIINFFSSMSAVIVPGATFSALQQDPGLNASVITSLSAFYMYAYAASQLCLGVLATKICSIGILLTGSAVFSISTILFPFCSAPWMLLALRLLNGASSGAIFIAITKMITELYSKHFAGVLGVIMFLGYLGMVSGGFPAAYLVDKFGWRKVIFMSGLASTISTVGAMLFSRNTLEATQPGSAFSGLVDIVKNRNVIRIFISSGIVFGIYYTILSVIGQKSLEDFGHFSSGSASAIVSGMAVIVSFGNLATGVIMKWCGSRRRMPLVTIAAVSLFCMLIGLLCCYLRLSGWILAFTYLAVAVSGGTFSIYSSVVKTYYPDNLAALAVAILNCVAFLFIALAGNGAGIVFSLGGGANADGKFSPELYGHLFSLFAFLAFLAIMLIPKESSSSKSTTEV